MIIGERLRALREEKKFSQGVVEERTGLLCGYISRVENGHTVPAGCGHRMGEQGQGCTDACPVLSVVQPHGRR